MTQLSRRAESERLCLLLGVPPERLAFLADMPTHETHVLVQAVLRAQSSIGVASLQPLIFWAQRLPPRSPVMGPGPSSASMWRAVISRVPGQSPQVLQRARARCALSAPGLTGITAMVPPPSVLAARGW